MVKQKRNYPTTIQVYLGSGEEGERIYQNLMTKLSPKESLSSKVMDLLRKADPSLFKVSANGK